MAKDLCPKNILNADQQISKQCNDEILMEV